MTDAMRKLVEAAKKAADRLDGQDGDYMGVSAMLRNALRAVEEEDAVEHALARKVLEAVRQRIGNCHDSLTKPDETLREAEREIMSQLSLLSSRSYEVVTIPQGETCDECPFAAKEYTEACDHPKCPTVGVGIWRPDGKKRSIWCRDRHGVKL